MTLEQHCTSNAMTLEQHCTSNAMTLEQHCTSNAMTLIATLHIKCNDINSNIAHQMQ